MPSVEADPTVQKRCRDGVQSLRLQPKKRPMPIVVIAISLLLTALQAPAEIRGAVVDLSGAAVPDATVTLIVDGNEQVSHVGGRRDLRGRWPSRNASCPGGRV